MSNYEMNLIAKRLEQGLIYCVDKYGKKEAKLADFIFRNALAQLQENVAANKLSTRRTTAAFIELVNVLDGAMEEIFCHPTHDN